MKKKSLLKATYQKIYVKTAPNAHKHEGVLSVSHFAYSCSLGKTGITAFKKEGDKATPLGDYKILYGFYRPDKIKLPQTTLPMLAITPDMGWCDEPTNANYNQLIKLPFKHSHEEMMREDRLYDICLALDYNITNRARNKGSAIFMHITKHKSAPTLGCIALEPEHMLQLLPKISQNTIVSITA